MNLRWLPFGAKRSELSDEIAAHLRMAAADKEADGVHAEEAQRQARREFGNLALVKDVTREMWGWLWLERIMQDVGFAVRQFRRAPAFAATVIGTFALGIGAATAMFTVVDHILLLPLPYAQADRLITIDVFNQRGDMALVSAANIEQWKERSHTFENIAPYRMQADRNFLQGRDFSLQIDVVEGGAELFRALGERPGLGSGFPAAESSTAIVLSDAAWQSAYGGDPAIVGKTVTINHSSFTVAGVMPAGFRFPLRGQPVIGDIPQAWVPFDAHITNSSFEIVARLAAHATPAGAEAELNTMQENLANSYTGLEYRDRPYSVRMNRYADTLVATDRKRALLILLAAAGALWLIAAMNVTNLLLARSTARQREIAMRGALGASRWRVTQQLVVEGMLLSGAAGVLGVFLAVAAIRFSRSAIPIRLHVDLSYHVNATILAALCGITLLSGLLSAAWPAFLAARAPIEPSLRRGGPQAGRNLGQNRVRSLLVIAQISISLTLLAACGWLLRSIYLLRQVPLGFRTDHVMVVSLAIPAYKFEHRSITADFYQPLLERVQHLPGVQAAGLLTRVPLSPGFAVDTRLHDADNPDRRIMARFQVASAEIQRVLGFRMLRGRFFDSGDTAAAEPVMVVNRAFAKVYGPNPQDAGSVLGRKFLVMRRWAKVVGVVDEERQESLTGSVQPEIVACIAQLPAIGSDDGTAAVMEGISMDLALRTPNPLSSVIPELRAAMARADLELTNADVVTMDQIVEDSYGNQRVAAHLLEVFGGVALLLCIAGIYGLLSYNVSQRTRELGIRLALGAPRSGVLWLVLRQTIALVIAGVAIGMALALVSGRLVQSLLFHVSTNDAWTLVIVAGVLLISALAAAWPPARRAAGVDPVEALRAG